jgi:4-oxalocrotonate tautomerase
VLLKVFGRAVAIYVCVQARPADCAIPLEHWNSNPHEWRNSMPLIQVQVIKDVFSKEQKRQIISKLTDAMVSIEGENMRQVTLCLVEEVESGDWGIGGKALTTADVHALARGKAA